MREIRGWLLRCRPMNLTLYLYYLMHPLMLSNISVNGHLMKILKFKQNVTWSDLYLRFWSRHLGFPLLFWFPRNSATAYGSTHQTRLDSNWIWNIPEVLSKLQYRAAFNTHIGNIQTPLKLGPIKQKQWLKNVFTRAVG